MLPLSIFLLSSAFCAALLVRYLTSYLLLFSWFVLFQSASLSPFDSILFPPPAALLVLLSGSLLASQLVGWLNFLGLQKVPTNQYFVVMQAGQSVFITFTTYTTYTTYESVTLIILWSPLWYWPSQLFLSCQNSFNLASKKILYIYCIQKKV